MSAVVRQHDGHSEQYFEVEMKGRRAALMLSAAALSLVVATHTWRGELALLTIRIGNTTALVRRNDLLINASTSYSPEQGAAPEGLRAKQTNYEPAEPGSGEEGAAQNDVPRPTPSENPRMFFVVTTSLTLHSKTQEGQKDFNVRRDQYFRGIRALLNATKPGFPLPHRVIVVENNGPRDTYLDEFEGVSVLYTNNNKLNDTSISKGTKELMDVLECIRHFQMRDNDLLVKMTGRYFLDETSPFMELLRALDWNTTQAIVKFGPFYRPSDEPMRDCITGLIMLPVSAIRQIRPADIIEHSWANATLSLSPQVQCTQSKVQWESISLPGEASTISWCKRVRGRILQYARSNFWRSGEPLRPHQCTVLS